jgi:hypothetical protein
VSSPASTGGQSARLHIIAAIGGVIRVGGASLMVPAGSLDRDTDIALAVGGQPPVGVPDLFQAAGPAVHGDLGGAHLTHGATLSLPLPAGVTGGVGAGYLDEQARAWRPRQAAIDSREHVLTLQVPHLSWYQPWTWDLGALKSKLEQYFGKLVGYGVALRTDPPHCAAAPSGVATAVTGGRSGDPSLDGCVEDAGGANVRLRLINNRPYGMVVTAPDGSRLESLSRGGLLAALYQEKNSLAHVGGDYLPSGGEADYILPATGPIVTAIGVWSWKTYTLDAAVAMLLTVEGEGAPPGGAAAAAKVGASASKVPPAKLASVGLCLGDKLFSDPPTDAASAIRDNIGCLGELDDLLLAPLALVQGLIIDLAGALDAGQDLSVGSAGTVTLSRPAPQPSSVTPSKRAERVGNAFLAAAVGGDKATMRRLASPEAYTVFEKWANGSPWSNAGRCSVASQEPYKCEITIVSGPPKEGNWALIFGMTFTIQDFGDPIISKIESHGDAG